MGYLVKLYASKPNEIAGYLNKYFQTLDMEETANIYIAVTNDDMTEVIDFVVADYLIESEGITEKSLTKIWHVDRDVYNNTGEG